LSAIQPGKRRWMMGLALVHALIACACGGGGSGSSTADSGRPPVTLPPPPPPPAPTPTTDCLTRDVFTLCVTVQDALARPETVEHMRELFFDVYPKLVDRFNRGAPLSVNFTIGPATFIAGASGNSVTYQSQYLFQHPEDYDVVVHEVMHIVQSYVSAPDGFTEGIADYARYRYGVNNQAAGWTMQMPAAGSKYTDGYGVTARFLVWVEARYKVAVVDALNAAIRGGSYDTGLWISVTGKTVDALWAEYIADPSL
jgi:hypothetical protein